MAIQIEENNLAENIIVSEKLAKEVRLLKAYAVVATIVCAALFTLLFVGVSRTQTFEEIDVERINIVEKTGELRMVISNQERQHPGIVNGKIIERGSHQDLMQLNGHYAHLFSLQDAGYK